MLHQNITHGVSEIGAINTMPAMFLNDSSKPEVLDFLETRPAQTAMLSGLVRDNGLRSDFNRGDFFGCRNEHGELEGVALIGHATLFETRSERALYSLASRAQNCTGTHMLMGEQDGVQMFWEFYAGRQAQMRKACREHDTASDEQNASASALPSLGLQDPGVAGDRCSRERWLRRDRHPTWPLGSGRRRGRRLARGHV